MRIVPAPQEIEQEAVPRDRLTVTDHHPDASQISSNNTLPLMQSHRKTVRECRGPMVGKLSPSMREHSGEWRRSAHQG